jgi:ribosomal protein L21
MSSYAIISLGGKQYRVQEGERLLVDRLKVDEGKTFEPRVLLVGGFRAGGFRAVPLETVRDVKLAADASGRGTITLIVDDGRHPQLAHVADAPAVRDLLLAAVQAASGRATLPAFPRLP